MERQFGEKKQIIKRQTLLTNKNFGTLWTFFNVSIWYSNTIGFLFFSG